MIELPYCLRRDELARCLGEKLREGDDPLEGHRVFLHDPFGPVRELLDALLDSNGERFPADRADILELPGL